VGEKKGGGKNIAPLREEEGKGGRKRSLFSLHGRVDSSRGGEVLVLFGPGMKKGGKRGGRRGTVFFRWKGRVSSFEGAPHGEELRILPLILKEESDPLFP